MESTTNRIKAVGRLILVAAFVSGAFLRSSLSFYMQVINVDATGYFKSGVILPDYLTGLSTFWSPLYPILCILVNHVLGDIEWAGKIVSIISGNVLIFLIYLFTIKLYGQLSAAIAALLIAFFPVMIYYSTFVTPEMTYLCFYFLGLILFIQWAEKTSTVAALFMGIACSCAYLTRPEGFLLFLQLISVGILVSVYRYFKHNKALLKPLLSLILFICSFVLIASPYLVKVREEVGFWTISPRSGANIALSPDSFEKKMFALTADKKSIRGFMYYAHTSLFDELKKDPNVITNKYRSNLSRLFIEVLPDMFVSKIILVTFLGLICASFIIRKNENLKHLFVLYLTLPILITPLFVIEVRTQIYLIPIIIVLSSVTLSWIFEANISRWAYSFDQWLMGKLVAICIAIVIVVVSFTYFYNSLLATHVKEKGLYGIEQKKAGIWLRNSGFPPGKIMARKPWIAFYSANEQVPIPLANFDDILYYASANQVKYFVIDDLVTSQARPTLKLLMENTPKQLSLIYDNQGGQGKRVRIFQIK